MIHNPGCNQRLEPEVSPEEQGALPNREDYGAWGPTELFEEFESQRSHPGQPDWIVGMAGVDSAGLDLA
jgi:hypothetical protein